MKDGVMFGNFDMVKFGGWCFNPSVIESVLVYDDHIVAFTPIRIYRVRASIDNSAPSNSLACLISLSADDFANFKAYVEREFFGMEGGEDE